MNQHKESQVRVFARQMARELLPLEVNQVSGGGASWCHIQDSSGDPKGGNHHLDDTVMIECP